MALAIISSTLVFIELRDSGVTVTALQPGPTDTDFPARAEHKIVTTAGEFLGQREAKTARGARDQGELVCHIRSHTCPQ